MLSLLVYVYIYRTIFFFNSWHFYLSNLTVCKDSACNTGDLGSIPGSGRSPGEGNGNQLQFSCLENPMDGGAWWATVHGSQSRTRLSDFTLLCLPQRLWSEKAMAPHSSTLAWKIPWTEEPGGLQSTGRRVGHD